MSFDIERLKVDESLWPDGAKWLIAPKPNNPNNRSFFAKTWNGNSGVKIDGETAHVMFKYWHEPIPRPTSPEWVDGLPPESIGEFRKSLALNLQNAIEAITGEVFSDDDALILAHDTMCKYNLTEK